LLGSALGAADRITLRLGEGTELGSLGVSFDCSNDGIPEGLLLGDILRSDNGTAPGPFFLGALEVMLEGSALEVPLGSTDGEVLGSDDGIILYDDMDPISLVQKSKSSFASSLNNADSTV